MRSRTSLAGWIIAATLVWATSAHAERKLRVNLGELPAIKQQAATSRVLWRASVTVDDSRRFDRAVWELTMRAQHVAEPRNGMPAVLPILSTTVIGATLRLDF